MVCHNMEEHESDGSVYEDMEAGKIAGRIVLEV